MKNTREPHYKYRVVLYSAELGDKVFRDNYEDCFTFKEAIKIAKQFHKWAQKDIKKGHRKQKVTPYTQESLLKDVVNQLIKSNKALVYTEGYEVSYGPIPQRTIYPQKNIFITDYIKIYKIGHAKTIEEEEKTISMLMQS